MKKITMLLVTMCMLFVSTACGNKKKIDEEALDSFLKAMSMITEYESANYGVKMDVEQEGIKAKMEMDGGFINDGPLQLTMNISMAASGVSIDDFMQLYLKDNTMYLSAMGEKQKQILDLSMLDNMNIGLDVDTMMDKKALKEMLKSASIEDHKIMMEFDVDKLNEGVKAIEDSGDEAASSLLETGAPSYDQFDLEVVVNKKGMLTSFVLEMAGKQGDTPMKIKLTWKMKDVNKVESLVFPEDLDSYPEAVENIEEQYETSGEEELASDEDFGF